jgi:hypothetical protein
LYNQERIEKVKHAKEEKEREREYVMEQFLKK